MDMMFIGYPKCSTSKKAEQWLKDNGFAYKFRNIVEENPTEDELRIWHKKSKLDIKRFFNTSGLKYRELNLKNRLKHMSDRVMCSASIAAISWTTSRSFITDTSTS